MLYYLFRFLEQWGISGSHMWGYISFRALLALILSLVISAWFGEKFIKYLKSKQITETQRDASIDPEQIRAQVMLYSQVALYFQRQGMIVHLREQADRPPRRIHDHGQTQTTCP